LRFYEESVHAFRDWEIAQPWSLSNINYASAVDNREYLTDTIDLGAASGSTQHQLSSTSQRSVEMAGKLLQECAKLLADSAKESYANASKLSQDTTAAEGLL
jgi:hypothetical protein